MPKRTLSSRLNNVSKMAGIDTSSYKPIRLDPESLVPSDDNFYHVDQEEIEKLADNMLHSGLIEPIIVARVDGRDCIVSGHRRREAALLNKKRGYAEFNEVNCMMREMNQNMFMITLASANAFTRKLTDFELVKQAETLRTYYKKAMDEDGLEIKGRMRDFIADKLGVSHTKMAQIDAINNNLTKEGKVALEKGEINFSKAYETSKLPVQEQSEVIRDKNLLSSDVKELAKKKMQEKKSNAPLPKISFEIHEIEKELSLSTIELSDYKFYKEHIRSLYCLKKKYFGNNEQADIKRGIFEQADIKRRIFAFEFLMKELENLHPDWKQ